MHKLITHSFALYTIENILKNSEFPVLVGISRLNTSRKNEIRKKLKTQNSNKNFRYCLASISRQSASGKNKLSKKLKTQKFK